MLQARKLVFHVFTLTAFVLLSACSGPTEDVRVKTCKQLASHLHAGGELTWQPHQEDIHEPEYAVIKLRSSGGGSVVRAVCRYEYDAAEETAETHVDPLSAYATVPYEMTLNGRAVSAVDLSKAMSALRIKAGKRLLEKAKHWSQ